jgi:hypothetical protein
MDAMTADPSSSSVFNPRPKLWKTALLLAGSAAFGGLAVVLWNRRELIQMHNHGANPAQEASLAPTSAQTEEEIF